MEGTDEFALTRRKFLLAGSAAVAAALVAPIAKETQALAAQTIGNEAEPVVLSKVAFEVNGKAANWNSIRAPRCSTPCASTCI